MEETVNILDHIGYVKFIALKYNRQGNLDDIIQEGMLGLLNASQTYDPELGIPFISYARWQVLHCVSRYVKKLDKAYAIETELEPVKVAPTKPKYIPEPYCPKKDIEKVLDIINKLPSDKVKQVLLRRYFSEGGDGEVPSLRDLAKELNTSFQAVHDNEQRGIRELRERLKWQS